MIILFTFKLTSCVKYVDLLRKKKRKKNKQTNKNKTWTIKVKKYYYDLQ